MNFDKKKETIWIELCRKSDEIEVPACIFQNENKRNSTLYIRRSSQYYCNCIRTRFITTDELHAHQCQHSVPLWVAPFSFMNMCVCGSHIKWSTGFLNISFCFLTFQTDISSVIFLIFLSFSSRIFCLHFPALLIVCFWWWCSCGEWTWALREYQNNNKKTVYRNQIRHFPQPLILAIFCLFLPSFYHRSRYLNKQC